MEKSHTLKLAGYCASLEIDKLPKQVIEKMKLCIRDFFGIVVGARQIGIADKIADFVCQNASKGSASVLGYGIKTSPAMASLATGTFAEILEYQDGVRKGGMHPASGVLPAALAVAEHNGNTGAEFLLAVFAGYEAASRISAAMAPSHLRRGYLPTGTVGAIGAAVAAGRLLKLRAEMLADAMGIAAFLTPVSIGENLWGAYTAKILHGGQGARVGVEAAEWAKLGLTGCPLEGSPDRPDGFCSVLSDAPDYSQFTQGLGTEFFVLDVYFKPYACCRVTHPAVEATLSLVEEHHIDPAHVAEVKVTTYEYAARTVGANYPDGSENFLKCQFSIPYVVAASIADRSISLPQFAAERIKEPGLLSLAGKVRVVGDPEFTKLWPGCRPNSVEITTTDGKRYVRRVDYALGDPRNPQSDQMLWDKFDFLVSLVLGKDRPRRIQERIDNLEKEGDLTGLINSLT